MACAAGAVLAAHGALPATALDAGEIEVVNQLNIVRSTLTALSADARLVAYTGDDSPAPGDTNGGEDALVRDMLASTTEVVSVRDDDTLGEPGAVVEAMSPDGRFVVFTSYADDLVPDDGDFTDDVFLRDRVLGTTTLVSVGLDGHPGDHADELSFDGDVSADGRYVAFTSKAPLVPGDTDEWDVFVRDMVAGTTKKISVGRGATDMPGESSRPVLSDDGRLVAFESNRPDLVVGDTNHEWDTFVANTRKSKIQRVSVSTSGEQGNDQTGLQPAISADGSTVAFVSLASNLVPGDTNLQPDVFVRDLAARTTVRVSITSTGAQTDRGSGRPSLSGDGRRIAFQSTSNVFVPGHTGFTEDVFVHDLDTATTTWASAKSNGEQSTRDCSGPTISDDGSSVAFYSVGILAPGALHGLGNIYLRHLG